LTLPSISESSEVMWSLASKVKDVSKDELDKAGQDLLAGGMKKSA